MKITRNIGMLLLSAWFIHIGLAAFVPTFRGLGMLIPILAIAAGISFLIGRVG